MLAYKADLYDCQFITVNPENTTRTCHDCSFVMDSHGSESLTLADCEWTCPQCDTEYPGKGLPKEQKAWPKVQTHSYDNLGM